MPKRSFKLNWKYAIGEVVLIFIGISLAIAFQNYFDERKQAQEGYELAERLLREVDTNREALALSINNTEDLVSHSAGLLSIMGEDYRNYSENQLDSLVFRAVLGAPRMSLSYGTLLEGINTGRISLLSSDSLKTLLYAWQDEAQDVESFEGIVENENSNQLLPYLYDNYSLRQMDQKFAPFQQHLPKSNLPKTDNRKILADRKFENMIDNKFFMQNLLLGFYTELNDKLKAIQTLLQAEIQK